MKKVFLLLACFQALSVFSQTEKTIALECTDKAAKWFFTINNKNLTITDNYTSSNSSQITNKNYELADGFLLVNWITTQKYYGTNESHETKYKFKINRYTQKFILDVEFTNVPKGAYEGYCKSFTDKKF